MKRVAVVGGGASGMMAAIMAAEGGGAVTIYERNDRVGRKLLSTGNGKCNFSNRDFHTAYYNGGRNRLDGYFAQFGVEETVSFFQNAGMLVKERNGYLYPWSEQASTVLDILRLEMKRLGVRVELQAEVRGIENRRGKDGGNSTFFLSASSGRKQEFDCVVLTCGGSAAPQTGSDGSGFRLAEQLGHRITAVVPALVQLRCDDDFLRVSAGVRCEALLKLGSEKQPIQQERGELQLTDYGISGIPVFQLSRTAAYLLKKERRLCIFIDLFPGFGAEEYVKLCQDRMDGRTGKNMEEFLLGMANKKVNQALLKRAGLKPSEDAETVRKERLRALLDSYRHLCVHVTDTNSFEQAQVSAGGVSMEEVSPHMESLLVSGLYLAGEMLDVDGRCGGYNLQWAWTSGAIAGKNAAVGHA